MNRIEFIEKLQRALAAGLNSSQVADNVRFYQDYIDGEIRKGKSEAEVLSMLGDPRLLAKSIIEANKHAGASEGTNRTYDEEMSGGSGAYGGGSSYGQDDTYGRGSAYGQDDTYGRGSAYGQSSTYRQGSSYGQSGMYRQGSSYGQDDVYDEKEGTGQNGKVIRLPGWLVMLIVTVVVVLLIGAALSLLSFFSPVIIGVLIVILCIKLFQGKK